MGEGGAEGGSSEPPLDLPLNPGVTGYSFQIKLFFLSEGLFKQCLSKKCRP